ncbi:MAG: M23 family metallopeptidase [Bacteroidota bacterium]
MRLVINVFILGVFVLLNTSFDLPHSNIWNYKVTNPLPSQTTQDTAFTLPQNYFGSPLDIPLTLAGNFGEPRRLHFHTGLDFRTNQVEGHAVLAAAEGYISRINVSGAGYGNALYVTHPNGYVTVYGHLQKFNPRIMQRLRKEQYTTESFAVDFDLLPYEISIKKGDTIALSGNSGGSGGPHLHFEIRDSLERVYNPLLFGYRLKDAMKPIVSSLKFYPLDELKYKSDGYRTKTYLKDGLYQLTSEIVKLNSSLVGISVNAHDVMNMTEAHTGIYNMTVFDGDRMIYEYKMDRISFTDRRDVLSHVDYPIFMNESRRAFHKCFTEPGNNAPVYCNLVNEGIVDLSDNKPHAIHIEISDYAGNVSLIKFKLQKDKSSTLFKTKELKYTTRFDYTHENEFSNPDIKVKIPKGCLFDTVYFNYSSTYSTEPNILSKVHQLGNSNIQVVNWFDLSIRTENMNPALNDKALVIFKDGAGGTTSRAGKFENGFIHTQIREFGTYYVKVDTTVPQIKVLNVVTGRNMRSHKKILVKITDNLSGISDFDTYIDEKWVLSDYDAKSATLTHTLNQNLSVGEHIFKVVVTDERKNIAEHSVKFVM